METYLFMEVKLEHMEMDIILQMISGFIILVCKIFKFLMLIYFSTNKKKKKSGKKSFLPTKLLQED